MRWSIDTAAATAAAAAAATATAAAAALCTPQRPPRAAAAPSASVRASTAARWRRIPRAHGAEAWQRGAHNALLVTGASDGTINFWHSGTGLCVGIFKVSKRPIRAMTWFIVPAGRAAAGAPGTAALYAGEKDALPGLDAGWKVRSTEQLTLESLERLRLVIGNAKGTVKVWGVDAKVCRGAHGGAHGGPSLEIDLKFCSRLPLFTKGISHMAAMLPMRVDATDLEARQVVAVVEERGTLLKLWALQRTKRAPAVARGGGGSSSRRAGRGAAPGAAGAVAGAAAASDACLSAAGTTLARSKTWPPPSATSSFSATKARTIGTGFTPRTEPLGAAAPRAEQLAPQPRTFAAEAEAQHSAAADARARASARAADALIRDDSDYSMELPPMWRDGDDEDVTSIATLLQNVQPHSAICCVLNDTAATRALVPLCAAPSDGDAHSLGSKSPLGRRGAQTPRFRGTGAHQAEGGGLNRDGSRRTPPNTPYDAFASLGGGGGGSRSSAGSRPTSPTQRIIAGVQRGDINIWHISYDTVRPLNTHTRVRASPTSLRCLRTDADDAYAAVLIAHITSPSAAISASS